MPHLLAYLLQVGVCTFSSPQTITTVALRGQDALQIPQHIK